MLVRQEGMLRIVCDECEAETWPFEEAEYDELMRHTKAAGFSMKGRLEKGSPNCVWENLCPDCQGREDRWSAFLKRR
jgi:hypothetical protein